ncbi:unnamed protein product [Medioppia subpectinata]|uniref:Serine protease n=1 Tax=Medioppia subpectinata TaxID=1979941 RepID=A0A7R9KJE9_9ACAR|nr:unnamed protein product [Medioppia subpectinata]CAG2104785.1 unnamed protein product [Medioppia subpectinata]
MDSTDKYTTDEIVGDFIDKFVKIFNTTGYYANGKDYYTYGSGIAIDSKYILTNCHVVDGYLGLEVWPFLGDYTGAVELMPFCENGKLVYAEPELDAALVRIPGELDLKPVKFATRVEAGEPLVIIGNPPLIDFTPAVGAVRTVDRSAQTLSLGDYYMAHNYPSADSRHLTHDCPQYGGYSGGPVINAAKEVVGLVWGGINVYRENCAIPSHSVTAFIERGLKFEVKDSEDRRTYRASKSLGLILKTVQMVGTEKCTIDEILEHFIYKFVLIYNTIGFDAENEISCLGGSGIVIDKEYILTNCHVIDGYKRVDVLPFGVDVEGNTVISYPSEEARLVYAEPELDAALIRIPGVELDIEAVEFGTTGVEVGEPLVIIGNPDIDCTPAVGLVQTVGRIGHTISVGNHQTFPHYVCDNFPNIMFDCQQYSGCSGGPVINAAKEVVGLLWGGIDVFRENCAIPSQSVTAFIERGLKFERKDAEDRYEYQTSKSLGLIVKSVSDMKTGIKRVYGTFDPTITAPFVYNTELLKTNSAAIETFMESDIIVAVNEMAVNSVSELRDCLQKCPTDQELNITVIRSLNPNNKIHIKVKPKLIVCSVI